MGDTSAGPVCLCAEEAGGGLVVIKEYLGSPAACRLALPDLHRIAPAERWLVRSPRSPEERVTSNCVASSLKAAPRQHRWGTPRAWQRRIRSSFAVTVSIQSTT